MQKVFEEILGKLSEAGGCDASCEYDKGWDKVIGEAIEIVKKAGDEYNDGWILCSSGKLPEECQGVDVTIEETLESGEKEYYTAHSWMQDGVWIVKKNPRKPKVIAWKYPAEPYIPKEKS